MDIYAKAFTRSVLVGAINPDQMETRQPLRDKLELDREFLVNPDK